MPQRPRPPLNPADLRGLALRYVGRYATTRAKLERYLGTKLRERGWSGDQPPDSAAIAAECVERGYIDDAAYAGQRADAMQRRGLGSRRIDMTLRAAGIAEPVRAAACDMDEDAALAAARGFARRRRLGPFAPGPPDPARRRRELAAMLRAGHAFAVARTVLEGDGDGEDAPASMLLDSSKPA